MPMSISRLKLRRSWTCSPVKMIFKKPSISGNIIKEYSREKTTMKEFMKKHPALEDTCDTVLSLLSGSFALLAVGFVWVKELIDRKNSKKD